MGGLRVALLVGLLTLALVGPARAAGIDAQAEVATALYAASATQAAAAKAADARITAQQAQIAALAAKVRAGAAQRAQLIAAEEGFVEELAANDRAYGAAIAVFRGAVVDICATPEGVAAMARFNSGDEAGALSILDALRAANDKARKTHEDIDSAAEGRRIAELAGEARSRGKQTTAQVIARYEDVVRLDPGVFWDWVELDRLYQAGGRLADARRAAEAGVKVAHDDAERTVALNEAGDVDMDAGDMAGRGGPTPRAWRSRAKLAAAGAGRRLSGARRGDQPGERRRRPDQAGRPRRRAGGARGGPGDQPQAGRRRSDQPGRAERCRHQPQPHRRRAHRPGGPHRRAQGL